MKIDKKLEEILEDGSDELIIQTNYQDLQFIGYILESFGGCCNYTTIDKDEMFLKIVIPKDFKYDVKNILNFLKDFEQ
ncbi:MAG: DUF4911 domain-containing protein [Candidatus Cloacimonetes bacterium]|nr:DUF4911 domain-containing protein [Candidatus Cloacimonadota bacterium]